MENNVELLRQYKELLDQGILSQEEFDAKKEEVLAKMKQTTVAETAPEATVIPQAAPQPQQNTYQTSPDFGLENTISSARTLGILAIVGACTITIAGLICGIIGLSKVKDLNVPPHLTERRDSAKRLNLIGIIIAVVLMIVAIIFVSVSGCSDGYYY